MKVKRSYNGTSLTSQTMNQKIIDDNFDINLLPKDLQLEYIKYLIIEVINNSQKNQVKLNTINAAFIDKDLLNKFALAILDSENVYIDIPVYISLLTMILYQEYNIEINSICDDIINVLYKALKA